MSKKEDIENKIENLNNKIEELKKERTTYGNMRVDINVSVLTALKKSSSYLSTADSILSEMSSFSIQGQQKDLQEEKTKIDNIIRLLEGDVLTECRNKIEQISKEINECEEKIKENKEKLEELEEREKEERESSKNSSQSRSNSTSYISKFFAKYFNGL